MSFIPRTLLVRTFLLISGVILATLGISPKKPDVYTPGWDMPPLVR